MSRTFKTDPHRVKVNRAHAKDKVPMHDPRCEDATYWRNSPRDTPCDYDGTYDRQCGAALAVPNFGKYFPRYRYTKDFNHYTHTKTRAHNRDELRKVRQAYYYGDDPDEVADGMMFSDFTYDNGYYYF